MGGGVGVAGGGEYEAGWSERAGTRDKGGGDEREREMWGVEGNSPHASTRTYNRRLGIIYGSEPTSAFE